MDEKKIISYTLRYGVIISSILIISGLFIFLLKEPSVKDVYAFNTTALTLNPLNPLSISLYGLIVLISLPVLIVAEQVIIYASEKDRIYTIVSLIVLSFMLFAILLMPRLLH